MKNYILYKEIDDDSGKCCLRTRTTENVDDGFSVEGCTIKVLKVYSSQEAVNVAQRIASDMQMIAQHLTKKLKTT